MAASVCRNSDAILVVEDDPDDFFFLRKALKSEGVECFVYVRNALEAMDYLCARGIYARRHVFPFPKLILLDIKMPGMDGFEFLRWLQEKGLAAPTVVWSASNLSEHMELALELGAVGYLTKPLAASDLSQQVKWLKKLLQNQAGQTPRGAV